MRKAGLIFIAVLGLLALVIDLHPSLRLPDFGPDGGTRTIETKLGLDLQGGLAVEYRVNPVGSERPEEADLAVIRDIIERRVNSTGVAEPVVVTQGEDRIVVELPGVQDTAAVRRLVGQTGELNFVPIPPGETPPTAGSLLELTRYPPLFRGDELSSASIGQDQNGGRSVDFVLKDNGSRLFEEHTRANIGNFFAIVLDGVVISAPRIQAAISGGRVQITQDGTIGGYPLREAQELVNVLQFGSLPFPIEELSSDTISPTLGQEFVDKSVTAGLIGIGLTLLFMLIHYRMPGVIAGGALIYYAILVFAAFRLIPVTLTLAGIAGFILSVGMAVDANILIFERTKEELRLGKSLPAAIEAGFNRAWSSILDSNVSSLITASILYFFGSSVIQGFALVLIIGVLISMFTAITVTRSVLRVMVDSDWARRASLYGVTEGEFVAWPTARSARRENRRV